MFISPMLLEKVKDPYSDPAYIFEPKLDGHRLILSYTEEVTRLYTRHNTDVTRQYPELHILHMMPSMILDGEICVLNEDGSESFEQLMQRFALSDLKRIARSMNTKPVTYFVFDILLYNSRDVRSLPLFERKEILKEALQHIQNPQIQEMLFIKEEGERLWQVIQQRDMEGMVAKKLESTYQSRRSKDWLKIINYKYIDAYIKGMMTEEFGWIIEIDTNAGRQYGGVIHVGVPPWAKKEFGTRIKSFIKEKKKKAVYWQEDIPITVKFRSWSENGLLRIPEFDGFR